MMKRTLAHALSAALVAGAVTQAQAASQRVEFTTTAAATYGADSPEARDVQRWLARHATFVNGNRLGEPGRMGGIEVVYTHAGTSAASGAVPDGGPPTPLPSDGNRGDQVAITSRSGDEMQAWTYAWTRSQGGSAWQLVDYRYLKNDAGGGNPGS